MTLHNFLAAGVMTLAGFSAAQAATAVVNTDGSWNQFDVSRDLAANGGLGWIDIADGSALSFQFTVASGFVGTLTVVDTGFSGDRFGVSVNGSLAQSTSAAINSYPSALGQADFEQALANTDYSRGVYTLAAGSYTITGNLSASALDGDGIALDATSGGLKVAVSAVPMPPSLLLMVSGLLGLAMQWRRRQHGK